MAVIVGCKQPLLMGFVIVDGCGMVIDYEIMIILVIVIDYGYYYYLIMVIIPVRVLEMVIIAGGSAPMAVIMREDLKNSVLGFPVRDRR